MIYVTLPKKDESDEKNSPDQQKVKDDSKGKGKQTRTKRNRHWINILSFDNFSLKDFNYCFDDLVNNDKDTYIMKKV